VGTLLRCVGGLVFVMTLLAPTVHGCGKDYSQIQLLADNPSAVGAGGLVAAIGFGVIAFAGPFLSKKPTRFWEGSMMLLAFAFAAAAVVFADVVVRKGGRMLWALGAQVVALGLVFAGASLRYRRARKRA
jgi:peptidoglycan/LPS O-acetylase OafA/YrhL